MENHQAAAFYTVISLISVFVSFILYVCWQLVVSTAKAEGSSGIRPVPQQIELSEIHPRRYNVSSQTNRSELLETRLKVLDLALVKEETRRKSSSDSLHLSDQSSHCQNCEAEKGRKRPEQSLISNSYYKTPYQTISEVYENETKMTANL